MEALKNISDLAKFFIMLLIYTGYMTWWASGISHDVKNNKEHINIHLSAKDHPQYQTQAITSLQKQQQDISRVMEANIAQHARCTIIMENIIRRLEKVEEFENAEHAWESK
jgi:hypothetical protein